MSPSPKTAGFSQCSRTPGRSAGRPFGGPIGGPINWFIRWLVGRFGDCFPVKKQQESSKRVCAGMVSNGSDRVRRVACHSNFVAQ